MNEITIKGTLEEELTSDEYATLMDILMQFGFENIEIEEESEYDR